MQDRRANRPRLRAKFAGRPNVGDGGCLVLQLLHNCGDLPSYMGTTMTDRKGRGRGHKLVIRLAHYLIESKDQVIRTMRSSESDALLAVRPTTPFAKKPPIPFDSRMSIDYSHVRCTRVLQGFAGQTMTFPSSCHWNTKYQPSCQEQHSETILAQRELAQ